MGLGGSADHPAVKVKEGQLREACRDYVIPESVFDEIGPAAVHAAVSSFLSRSSRATAKQLAKCLAGSSTARFSYPTPFMFMGNHPDFDESNHQPAPVPGTTPESDSRWVLCRRPVIIAGGEMTEAALEPKYQTTPEVPPKVLRHRKLPINFSPTMGSPSVIDFLAPEISRKALLNRWMSSPEVLSRISGYLHTGQQFAVPFDQLIIFFVRIESGPHRLPGG